MRLFHRGLAVGLWVVVSSSMLASRDAQTPKPAAKPLTNVDVVDLLKGGLSQEIVIAKINASTCEFDTSPAALKALKTANIPDAVILAMVQVHSEPTPTAVQQFTTAEASASARVDCTHADPVLVFSAPRPPQPLDPSRTDSVVVFKVKCGDRITILGDDKQSWLKMRSVDGQVGFISSAVVSIEPSAEKKREETAEKKREEIQRAADDREDCSVRAQNEYQTKMNLVATLTLTAIQRVYASSRLKQNLDAELKSCRTQYESRMKALGAE